MLMGLGLGSQLALIGAILHVKMKPGRESTDAWHSALPCLLYRMYEKEFVRVIHGDAV